MYEIILSQTARNSLKNLENAVQKRIISALERIRIRPEAHVRKLIDFPYYRLRVGDYRVILDIQQKNLIILIIEIGHRNKIYKKLGPT